MTGATTFGSTVNAGILDVRADSFAFSSNIWWWQGMRPWERPVRSLSCGAATIGARFTVTQATAINLAGTVNAAEIDLTAANTITFGTGGVFATTGDIRLVTTAVGAGNGITANGIVDAKSALIIDSVRGVTLNATVDAGSIDIDAVSINYGTLVTNDGGSATLTASATGSITATGTTTVAGDLSIVRALNVSLSWIDYRRWRVHSGRDAWLLARYDHAG